MAGIWWTKVELKEDFCEHYCEMTDKEIVNDVRKSINSILKQRPEGDDFGAKMVKKAMERVQSKHDIAVANGARGGTAKARNKKEAETRNATYQGHEQHTQPQQPPQGKTEAPPQDQFYDFSTPAKNGPVFSLNGKSFDIAKVAKTATSKNGNGDVMNLAYSGEFQNVKLTQDQYNELCIKFANMSALNRAIDSLSSKLENGELQPVPKNHYAVLVKWAAYRDDRREEKDEDAERNKYETVSQHNMRVLKQANEFVMNGGMEKLKNGTY